MSRHEIHVETTIQATPAEVYEVVSDLKHLADWMPNVTRVKVLAAKKGVGAERQIHLRIHDMDLTSHQRVVLAKPPSTFGWVHVRDTVDGKPFEMLEDVGTTIHLERDGKSTKVQATAHFTPRGFKARLAVPLVSHDVRKQMRAAIDSLKRLVESGA